MTSKTPWEIAKLYVQRKDRLEYILSVNDDIFDTVFESDKKLYKEIKLQFLASPEAQKLYPRARIVVSIEYQVYESFENFQFHRFLHFLQYGSQVEGGNWKNFTSYEAFMQKITDKYSPFIEPMSQLLFHLLDDSYHALKRSVADDFVEKYDSGTKDKEAITLEFYCKSELHLLIKSLKNIPEYGQQELMQNSFFNKSILMILLQKENILEFFKVFLPLLEEMEEILIEELGKLTVEVPESWELI